MLTYITESIFFVLVSDCPRLELAFDELFLNLDQVYTSSTTSLIVNLLLLADWHDQLFVEISVHVAEEYDGVEEVLLLIEGVG